MEGTEGCFDMEALCLTFSGFGTTQTANTGGLFGSTQPPAASASLFSQTGTGCKYFELNKGNQK